MGDSWPLRSQTSGRSLVCLECLQATEELTWRSLQDDWVCLSCEGDEDTAMQEVWGDREDTAMQGVWGDDGASLDEADGEDAAVQMDTAVQEAWEDEGPSLDEAKGEDRMRLSACDVGVQSLDEADSEEDNPTVEAATQTMEADSEAHDVESDDDDDDELPLYVRGPSTSLSERAQLLKVSPEHLSLLFKMNLPKAFYTILFFLASCDTVSHMADLNCVEFFAGVKSITRGMKAEGLAAASYEIKDDPVCKDLNGIQGYLFAVQMCRRLVPKKSMTWHAPVCSTWVFMNLGTSRRSSRHPYGDDDVESVRDANCMVWRMVYLILFALGLNSYFFIEQPCSSILVHHPAMAFLKYVCRRIGQPWQMVSTWLGMFGAPSRKGIKVWSNAPWAKRLKRKLDVKKKFENTDVFRKYKDTVCWQASTCH